MRGVSLSLTKTGVSLLTPGYRFLYERTAPSNRKTLATCHLAKRIPFRRWELHEALYIAYQQSVLQDGSGSIMMWDPFCYQFSGLNIIKHAWDMMKYSLHFVRSNTQQTTLMASSGKSKTPILLSRCTILCRRRFLVEVKYDT